MNWFVFLAVVSIVSGGCPGDWWMFQQTCLALFKQQLTWSKAQAMCSSNGARLATLENYDKDMNMKEFIHTIERFDGFAIWVGGTDVLKESHWVWNDKELHTFTYTNWGHGQPNNLHNEQWHGENCVALDVAHGRYSWMDNSCEERPLPFVCEREVGPPVLMG